MLYAIPSNVLYICEAPKIEIAGGIVRIIARSGAEQREGTMSVANFARYVERGQRALRQHAAGDEFIIIND